MRMTQNRRSVQNHRGLQDVIGKYSPISTQVFQTLRKYRAQTKKGTAKNESLKK